MEQGNGSAIKNTGCSSQGPGFNPSIHIEAHNWKLPSIILVSKNPTPTSYLYNVIAGQALIHI